MLSRPHNHLSMAYRPDIDGLRAIAVTLVVLFHAFPTILPGGFIGVDIFFVISGYLIGGIIFLNLRNGAFSFANFYSRRILRIFPALCVVLFAVLAAGWFWLFPDEFRSLGKHVLGGAIFADNFMLLRETGYFDAAAHTKPLLNLWSLGIEEQYYIFFPLIIWFLWKRKLSILFAIAVLLALSFIDNIHLLHASPNGDFFSPLPRVWELLAGALARYIQQITNFEPGNKTSLICFVSGMCILLVGVVLVRQNAGFPGYQACIPVLATVILLIGGNHDQLGARILANPASVFLGKISYPLYLWHWPLLSFAFIIYGSTDAVSNTARVLLVIMAVMLATLTWQFVEKPVRFHRILGGRTIVVLCCGMVGIAVLGFSTWYYKGFPGRSRLANVKNAIIEIQAEEQSVANDPRALRYARITKGQLEDCRYYNAGASQTVAIVGDSHASAAFSGLAKLGQELVNQYGKDGGFNTLVLSRFVPVPTDNPYHANSMDQPPVILKVIESHPDIKVVIIVTRIMCYITGIDSPDDPGSKTNVPEAAAGADAVQGVLQNLADKIAAMGKQVFIVAENPELPKDIRAIIKRDFGGFSLARDNIVLPREKVFRRQQPGIDMLHRIKIHGNEIAIDALDALCPARDCLLLGEDGHPLYYDDDHLSAYGSSYLAQKVLRPVLEPIFRDAQDQLE